MKKDNKRGTIRCEPSVASNQTARSLGRPIYATRWCPHHSGAAACAVASIARPGSSGSDRTLLRVGTNTRPQPRSDRRRPPRRAAPPLYIYTSPAPFPPRRPTYPGKSNSSPPPPPSASPAVGEIRVGPPGNPSLALVPPVISPPNPTAGSHRRRRRRWWRGDDGDRGGVGRAAGHVRADRRVLALLGALRRAGRGGAARRIPAAH